MSLLQRFKRKSKAESVKKSPRRKMTTPAKNSHSTTMQSSAMNPVSAALSTKEWEKQRKLRHKQMLEDKKQAEKLMKKEQRSQKLAAQKTKKKAKSDDGALSVNFMPKLIALAVVIVSGLLLFQGMFFTREVLKQSVLTVDIEANFIHLQKDSVTELISASVSEGYLDTDLPGLHKRLVDQPWVKEAYLKRKMDNGLHIQLVEHMPLAFWNQKEVLSVEGVVFEPELIPEHLILPKLHGVNHEEALLLYQDIAEQLPEYVLPIIELHALADKTLILKLSNDIDLVMAYNDWKIQLERFLVVLDKSLYKKINDVLLVDMRYSNGAAVSFKQQSLASVTN